MKLLQLNDTLLISGGKSENLLLGVLSSTAVGGYLGSYLAYLEIFMNMTVTAGIGIAPVVAYSVNPLVLVSGIVFGSTCGYALSIGVLQASGAL